uniref:Bifunctional inhibitor/plant lipid transfer protein/seed storage helical domain-containing protein n=2 Tax=Oryza TaxID=4527 RepID=A0A0E0AGE0_9ORYZ
MELNKAVAVAVAAAMVAVVAMVAAPASGQAVAASCTASLITSFTPCFNFITGSSGGGGGNGTAAGGGAPTAECCQSVAAMINTSASCACLVLTGNVPLGIPINRTLAVTLPKACNSMSVPLQCKDTSAQIPAAGVPVAVSPAMPPLPPSPPESTAGAGSPTATATPPATSQTQTRPQVVPSSARRVATNAGFPAFLLLLAAMLF